MFTGIVQGLISVVNIDHVGDISRLSLQLRDLADGIALGASVAVNGTCLTVTNVQSGIASFDIIDETLKTTNLGSLKNQDLVNVERSFRVGDEVGGHLLSGHVTGTSRILSRKVEGNINVLRLDIDDTWTNYVFHKGFIAIDGASLTISRLSKQERWFEISLIPETIARTTLGHVAEGDLMNIEVDAQTITTVQTVERLLSDPNWLSERGNTVVS